VVHPNLAFSQRKAYILIYWLWRGCLCT